MPNDFIGLEVQGIKEVQKMLTYITPEVKENVMGDVEKFVYDVVRIYPKERHIKRKTAFGVTFFSDKQRRFYFWALKTGRINVPYKRTYGLRDNWKVTKQAQQYLITNPSPYAAYVMGEKQSRMMSRIGWKTIPTLIKDRMGSIFQKANTAAQRGIESAKRKAGVR